MRRIFLYLFLIISLWGRGAAVSPFAQLSSARLLERSRRLERLGQNADSSLIYLTEVLGRYYDNPVGPKGAGEAVEALRAMADIYWNAFHDYGSTVTSISTAIELAEAEGLTEYLPYLYLDMARLWDTNGLAFRDGNATAESLMHKAYATAVNAGNLKALPTVAFNMCVFRIARGQEYFTDELAEIYRRPMPPGAPCAAFSDKYIDATRALEAKDYTRAGTLFHTVATARAADPDERRAVLGAMQLEAEMRRLEGDAPGARTLLLGYLNAPRTDSLPGYTQAICRKLASLYRDAGMDDSAIYYEARWLRERETERQNSLLTPSEMVQLSAAPSAELRMRDNHIARLKRERQLIFVIGALALLLIAALFILRAWRVQKRNARTLFEQNKALLEDAAQLRELRAKLESARTREAPSLKPQKYEASVIDPSMSADLYQQLLHIMDTNDDIYKTGFRLDDLAALAGMLPRYVSQVINENSGSNFNQLLNQYRIREVQRRLRDPDHYGQLTIEAVAESVGFMSRSTFAQIFKRHTGLTPTQYRRMAPSK